MRVTFLGTGTSHGIPRIGCHCGVCRSADPRNQRLRPSILVQNDAGSVLVDATPDFRLQALRANLQGIDAVLLTHAHADHMLGLDDLRVFTTRAPLTVYGSASTLRDVARVFSYACVEKPLYEGMPHFVLQPIGEDAEIQVAGMRCRVLPAWHGRLPVHGFQFGKAVAYLTDCSVVPDTTIAALRGVTVLVIDALRNRPHPTHLTVAEALAIADLVQPKLTLLTHICHDLDHATTEASLPATARMAYDGLQLEVNDDDWRIVA